MISIRRMSSNLYGDNAQGHASQLIAESIFEPHFQHAQCCSGEGPLLQGEAGLLPDEQRGWLQELLRFRRNQLQRVSLHQRPPARRICDLPRSGRTDIDRWNSRCTSIASRSWSKDRTIPALTPCSPTLHQATPRFCTSTAPRVSKSRRRR